MLIFVRLQIEAMQHSRSAIVSDFESFSKLRRLEEKLMFREQWYQLQ